MNKIILTLFIFILGCDMEQQTRPEPKFKFGNKVILVNDFFENCTGTVMDVITIIDLYKYKLVDIKCEHIKNKKIVPLYIKVMENKMKLLELKK